MAGTGQGLFVGVAVLGMVALGWAARAETIPLPTPAPLPKETGSPSKSGTAAQSGSSDAVGRSRELLFGLRLNFQSYFRFCHMGVAGGNVRAL